MKNSRYGVTVALLFAVVVAVVGPRLASAAPVLAVIHWFEDGRPLGFHDGFYVAPRGTTRPGTLISFMQMYPSDASDAGAGSWSSISAARSSSGSFTATGARVGDSCSVAYGAAVAAANQLLQETCQITASDTCTLYISNITAGSLTPTSGQRFCFVEGP